MTGGCGWYEGASGIGSYEAFSAVQSHLPMSPLQQVLVERVTITLPYRECQAHISDTRPILVAAKLGRNDNVLEIGRTAGMVTSFNGQGLVLPAAEEAYYSFNSRNPFNIPVRGEFRVYDRMGNEWLVSYEEDVPGHRIGNWYPASGKSIVTGGQGFYAGIAGRADYEFFAANLTGWRQAAFVTYPQVLVARLPGQFTTGSHS